jgi:hypothetical protein
VIVHEQEHKNSVGEKLASMSVSGVGQRTKRTSSLGVESACFSMRIACLRIDLGRRDLSGLIGDTAGIGSIEETDVTGLTPARRPRVTHGPILLAGRRVDAITDELDAVIESRVRRLASGVGREDTGHVRLPCRSIDADRHRSDIVQRLGELRLVLVGAGVY